MSRRLRRRWRLHRALGGATILATVWAPIGCASSGGGEDEEGSTAGPGPCEPVSETLAADVETVWLEGVFEITMIATEGPETGASVVGRLTLRPHEASMVPLETPEGRLRPEARVPFYGPAEIALETVGAEIAGRVDASDPAAPGVAVLALYEGEGGPLTALILRFGSEANRRDVVRFDGAFTALYVRSLESARFSGAWASGVPGQDPAEGHFCAVRIPG